MTFEEQAKVRRVSGKDPAPISISEARERMKLPRGVKPLFLTQSTVADWTRCPRKFWLKDYRGLRKKQDLWTPTTIGNLVHDALAHHYSGGRDPIGVIRDQAVALIEAYPTAAETIAADAEMAGIMCEGYFEWLEETGADQDFEVTEPEREITIQIGVLPTGRPVILRGKLDVKIRKRDGWLGFLETKSVGNFIDLPSYAQQDRQLLTYELLELMEARAQGVTHPLVDGAVLNMLRRVKRTASAKPPFYARVEVHHNIEELRMFWRHTMAVARQIDETEGKLAAGGDHHRLVPPVPTRDCRYACPYNQICPLFDDGSDVEWVLASAFEAVDPFERYSPAE